MAIVSRNGEIIKYVTYNMILEVIIRLLSTRNNTANKKINKIKCLPGHKRLLDETVIN